MPRIKKNVKKDKPVQPVRITVPKHLTAAEAKKILAEGPRNKNEHEVLKSNHVELPHNLTKDGVEILLKQLSNMRPGEKIDLQMGNHNGFWIGDYAKSIAERTNFLSDAESITHQEKLDEARERLNLKSAGNAEGGKVREIGYFTSSFVQLTDMASHLSIMLEKSNELIKRLDGEETESPRNFVKQENYMHLSEDQKEWPVKEKIKILTLILEANQATLQILNDRLSKLVM